MLENSNTLYINKVYKMYGDQIQNKRDYQEDRYMLISNIIPNYDYFAVFDGHGGSIVSELANQHIPNLVKKFLLEGKTPVISLYKAFEDFNQNVINFDNGYHCGSAALVGLKNNNKVYIANSGDSRAVSRNSEITIDHKPHLQKEYNRIIKIGGSVINHDGVPRLNGDLALSRAFGDFRLSPVITWKPDIYTFDYDGLLVLASDGLWDVMTSKEVSNAFINKNIEIKTICNRLFKESMNRGSGDNITILVI